MTSPFGEILFHIGYLFLYKRKSRNLSLQFREILYLAKFVCLYGFRMKLHELFIVSIFRKVCTEYKSHCSRLKIIYRGKGVCEHWSGFAMSL